ncbi:MAG: hypothetical protein CVV56_09010 [Tenericutes bacterium HGW-Tenericutes-1]|jgi:hypothetical protein|nr:MAG: hypothetical protein CVV56_09010 [Tenericutes bacterium HGW-Tenericutes-1]
MNILILDNYYNGFLQSFYSCHPEVKKQNFEENRSSIMSQRFGTSDAYSHNLKKLGHDAQEIITNDDYLQIKWAHENGIKPLPLPLPRYLNYGLNYILDYDWRYKIIKAQVEKIKPDVLYIQEYNILSDGFIAKLKPLVKLIVGQVASPIPIHRSYKYYDLILTSFPHFVERFRKKGIKSEYFRLAFDERILKEVNLFDPKYEVTFIGGISKAHRHGKELINEVSNHLPIELFGYGKNALDPLSIAYKHHHGEVWGLEMYKILAQSRITLNRHVDIAENYANNMRLFEATGMGACLVTDWKENLHTLFEPEKEVVTYRCADELVEKVTYLLENDKECQKIARAGQKRTLKEHTYQNRMKELLEILDEYI